MKVEQKQDQKVVAVSEVTVKEKAPVVELTDEVIEQWKKEYGKIYKSKINGQSFVWKKLKRKDYVEIMSSPDEEKNNTDIYDRQEEITKLCVLFPNNVDELIADNGGLATALSDEILGKSGFDIEDTVEL